MMFRHAESQLQKRCYRGKSDAVCHMTDSTTLSHDSDHTCNSGTKVPYRSVVVGQNQRGGCLVGQLEVHSKFSVTCLLGPVSGSHILDMETVLDHLLSTDRESSVLFAQFLRPLCANSIGLGIAHECVQAFSGTIRIGLIKKELVDLVHSTASCKPQKAFQVDMGTPNNFRAVLLSRLAPESRCAGTQREALPHTSRVHPDNHCPGNHLKPLSLFSLKCLQQVWVTPALLQVFWKRKSSGFKVADPQMGARGNLCKRINGLFSGSLPRHGVHTLKSVTQALATANLNILRDLQMVKGISVVVCMQKWCVGRQQA
jgi:hypothetical protein